MPARDWPRVFTAEYKLRIQEAATAAERGGIGTLLRREDVFSRYVTGWMVAMRESAELAKHLIEHSCAKQNIRPGQLTLHADRGTSMNSKPVAFLLADLGVTKTHSRPHVCDDNPYSKSHFRTMKYRPEFPDRFGCIQDSRAFSQGFFRWYNDEHRHSGLGLLTPAMVHYHQTALILEQPNRSRCRLPHPSRTLRPPSSKTTSGANRGLDQQTAQLKLKILTKFHEHWSQTR